MKTPAWLNSALGTARAVETQAMQLQAESLTKGQEALRMQDFVAAKAWWIAERSFAEAVHALKTLRKAPLHGLKAHPNPPRLDPEGLDWMGVPEKKDVTGQTLRS